jgi:hypothetical protein
VVTAETLSEPNLRTEITIMKTTRKTAAKETGQPRKSKARKTHAPRKAPARKPAPTRKPARQARTGTKQETVMEMLKTKAGATIPAIMKVTGWQAHSVRGFLSGHVKKKLGLTVAREKTDGDSIYRIKDAKPGAGRKRR